MNPLMRLMLMGSGTGFGERFSGNKDSDLASLTDALAAYKRSAGSDPNEDAKGDSQKASPIDRIKAAFEQLKDMHKSPDEQPSPFDTMHWPYGPIGAPSQANAQAPQPPQQSAPQINPDGSIAGAVGPTSVGGAPLVGGQAPQQPALMSFFQRNAAMMKDPSTGGYIDPNAAATANAQPGIFSKLFG